MNLSNLFIYTKEEMPRSEIYIIGDIIAYIGSFYRADIAAFILPLMKPFSPSVKYSFLDIYSRFDPISKMRVFSEVAWIESSKSILPTEVYLALKGNYGGFGFNFLEV